MVLFMIGVGDYLVIVFGFDDCAVLFLSIIIIDALIICMEWLVDLNLNFLVNWLFELKILMFIYHLLVIESVLIWSIHP